MAKKNIDYSNTIIYKIYCREPNIKEIYIGHTSNFVNRKSLHKSSCKNSSSKLYCYIRENGGWDNWKIKIIDDIECKNFEEARKAEQSYIDKFNSKLNTSIAYSIKDEDNKLMKQEKNETTEIQKPKEVTVVALLMEQNKMLMEQNKEQKQQLEKKDELNKQQVELLTNIIKDIALQIG